MVADFFRFFLCSVASYLPLILLRIVGAPFALALSGNFAFEAATLGFTLLGIIYWPVSLMLGGMFHSGFAAFNYVHGVRTIVLSARHYFICVLYFLATVIGLGWLLGEVFAALSGNLPLLMLAALLNIIAMVYMWALQMRVLGLVYACNEERIDLFG